jgi:MMPL family
MTVALRDTRDYYNHDTRFIVIATIIIVLLILMALLRAVIAPLYLILSVLISYASATGIGVIVFQFLLGQELHWSSPGLTFILLVAVGADYNLLLISRIRDESPHGVRSGVIRTVGSTGAVITSAGLIFAASMFGLAFASISTMVQIGFIIGAGILLDTFLVRTITVPAVAALVGQANWWPSRLRPQATPTHLTSDDGEHHTRVVVPASVANRHSYAHEVHEHLTPHTLQLFGRGSAQVQLPINGQQPAVNAQTTAHSERLRQTKRQSPVEEHPLPPCERWRCLGTSPYDCASQLTCLRTRPVERVAQPHTNCAHLPQTDGPPPAETNGQHLADINPVITPPVNSSPEGHQITAPLWTGRWPANDATFPTDTDSAHYPAAPRHPARWPEADRSRR